MISKKPKILFFSRDYQSNFFPELVSEKYDSIHVTLNIKEKTNIEKKGGIVVGCYEENFKSLNEANISFPYLVHSVGSDRAIKGHSLEERLSILRKTVSFWSGIYEKHKPNYIVNEVVALEISEVMYIEAKKRGIKYLAFGAFSVKKLFYWHENPFHSSMSKKIENMIPSEQDYQDASDYINKINTGAIDNPFIKEYNLGKDIRRLEIILKGILYGFYMNLLKNKIISQVCYQTSVKDSISELGYYLNCIFKNRFYDKMIDLNENNQCVFYPMHFEPEATMFYMSTYYDNQFSVVENILKCLKENDLLLVKEHPAQAGFLMQRKWIKLKNRFPNLKLIKAEVSSKEIILKSKTVITLVSTAGFEAAILGKNVIVLGKIYFDSFDGVNYCSTYEQVYDLLRENKPYANSFRLKEQLAKLIAMQYPGNPWPHKELYSTKNISDIINAIEKEALL